jgi:hypothetical protein
VNRFPQRNLLPGDALVLAVCSTLVAWLAVVNWGKDAGDTLIVHSGDNPVRELPLSRDTIEGVAGPLGITRVQIEQRRARVLSDPGPRQYCVRQGWISRPGESAICLPNQVSIEVGGVRGFDSLNY